MGLIPRIIREIFAELQKDEYEEIQFTLKCSYVEIYMEKIRDLLIEKQSNQISVKEVLT